jgi:Predicted AAA-ATPase/PD-(D/E)XK nuclease superfamily
MLRLPVGNENFGSIRENKLDLVDKTLLIKELLDNPTPEIVLITRPRRFGKTLNLSMLEHFFSPQAYGMRTAGLFDDLKISQCGEQYMRHQGQYPVIFITLKDIKDSRYEKAYAKLSVLIANVYQEHQYLLSSDKLTEIQKENFLNILRRTETEEIIINSLKDLCIYLYQHFGKKTWLLIDEYDTPLQAAYSHDYLVEMLELMRGFFGMTLKTNPYLNRAVLTGILKISKENLFSDLNNIGVYSLLNSRFGQYFGFTEDEMEEILQKSGLQNQTQQIRDWYNGYQVGDIIVYNPWSIAKCLENKGNIQPYWVYTSSNDLIKKLMAQSEESVKDDFQTILAEKPIEAVINPNIVFDDLGKDRDSLYTLLLFSGYLKATKCHQQDLYFHCTLTPPNREVFILYRSVILSWFEEPMTRKGYQAFLQSLVTGKIEEFTARLQDYLLESMSFFNSKGTHPENFYHGFVLGLMVSLKETHEVRSNRESGYGVYDIMLIPKDKNQLALILEFKSVRDAKKNLQQAAEEALQQIKNRHYAAELKSRGFEKILSLDLAFHGKQVAVLIGS